MAYRATAAVALDAGDAADGRRRGRSRRPTLADDVGTPVEAGLARTLAGRALAQLGERDARRRSNSSRRPPSSTAAARSRYRDAAERELRELGQRIHRRTRPGDASRTASRR